MEEQEGFPKIMGRHLEKREQIKGENKFIGRRGRAFSSRKRIMEWEEKVASLLFENQTEGGQEENQ